MKRQLLVVGIVCMAGILHADAFKLQSALSEDIIPERVIERDETGITVTYTIPGAVIMEDDLYPGLYQMQIPEFGRNHTLEEPEWPVRSDSFEIPEGYEASISLLSADWRALDISLAPSRPLLIDSSDEVYSLANVPPVKDFSGTLPVSPVAIYDRQIYRDRQIAYVEVLPVKCNGTQGTMVCENLSYRIDFVPSNSTMNKKADKIRHDVDEEYMNSLFTSTLSDEKEVMTLATTSTTNWKSAPLYLILSIPAYKTHVDAFAEWKKCMGFNTEVIYSSSWDTTSIKQQIKAKYDLNPSLQYVLLVGNAVSLPPVRHPKGSGSPSLHYSDYTYGCMDGDSDMEQDIIIGRLNVSNTSEAAVVINKVINYEKNPPANNAYYTNSFHAAYFQDNTDDSYEDRRFSRTAEDIRNGVNNEGYSVKRIYSTNSSNPLYWNNGTYAYGESLVSELRKPNFNWNGKTSDITSAINNGTFYIYHRGHGDYWEWNSPEFHINSVATLNNGALLPVCFSINCQTGGFSHTNDTIYNPYTKAKEILKLSFAESILRKANGGAVGIIAGSEVSFSGPNDVLSMEMFQSIWPNSNIATDFPFYSHNKIENSKTPVYAIGKILQRGKNGLVNKYSDAYYIPYTKRIFHCFGDPSMEMYTAMPQKVSVSAGESLHMSTILLTSAPAQMALIMNDGTVQVAKGTSFEIETLKSNDIKKITITGHNLIPVIGDNLKTLSLTPNESEIINISKNPDCIDVDYENPAENNIIVRMKSVSSLYSPYIEYPANNGKASISTQDMEKGIYVIELVEEGITVDSRKIAL